MKIWRFIKLKPLNTLRYCNYYSSISCIVFLKEKVSSAVLVCARMSHVGVTSYLNPVNPLDYYYLYLSAHLRQNLIALIIDSALHKVIKGM